MSAAGPGVTPTKQMPRSSSHNGEATVALTPVLPVPRLINLRAARGGMTPKPFVPRALTNSRATPLVIPSERMPGFLTYNGAAAPALTPRTGVPLRHLFGGAESSVTPKPAVPCQTLTRGQPSVDAQMNDAAQLKELTGHCPSEAHGVSAGHGRTHAHEGV